MYFGIFELVETVVKANYGICKYSFDEKKKLRIYLNQKQKNMRKAT